MPMKEETQESRSSLALWVLYFNVVHEIFLTNMLVFKNSFVSFISKKIQDFYAIQLLAIKLLILAILLFCKKDL